MLYRESKGSLQELVKRLRGCYDVPSSPLGLSHPSECLARGGRVAGGGWLFKKGGSLLISGFGRSEKQARCALRAAAIKSTATQAGVSGAMLFICCLGGFISLERPPCFSGARMGVALFSFLFFQPINEVSLAHQSHGSLLCAKHQAELSLPAWRGGAGLSSPRQGTSCR